MPNTKDRTYDNPEEVCVGEWQTVDGYCATRVTLDGQRVAFIEKTPRVKDPKTGKWLEGPKGPGGSGDVEEQGLYGYSGRSREWCDEKLEELGYNLL